MKKYAAIVALTALIISCKSDIEKLRAERIEITKEIADYNTKLQEVNEKIALLDKKSEVETIIPYTVNSQPFHHGITLQSSVSTDQDVILYPEFAGSITWLVSEGQRVGKGQVLANINDGGLSSQLKQAQIQADLAKTAYDKQAKLWSEYKIGSEIQYLQAKTAYEAAQKSISAIQSQLSRTKLKAPFSGTIDNLIVQSGQAVAPGVPLAKLVSLGNLKVAAEVSEQFISDIKVGTLVHVYLPALDRRLQSRVSRVSNAINPSNRTFSVDIPLSNPDNMIKPNMSAKLDVIDYHNTNVLSIPNKAIGTNAKGEKFTYVLKKINKNSAIATKTIIQIGQSNSENTEILKGLNVGDKIVLEGNKSVVDNTPVRF